VNKVGKILFGFIILILSIKLYKSISSDYDLIRTLNPHGLSIKTLIRTMWNYGVLFESIVVLISLSGFLVRGKVGFTLTLLFSYFVIAYGVVTWLSIYSLYGELEWEQLSLAFIIGIPLNINKTVKLFSRDINIKKQIIANLISFYVGFVIVLGIIFVGYLIN
jgi:hypothetical protein